MAFPSLEVEHWLQMLDQLAATMGSYLLASPVGRGRAQRFLQIFSDELGFTGNQDNYYDPDNSFLNQVLQRRTGLPILLSLVCMAIGRRIPVKVEGMGFPGHFMVRYQDGEEAWLLDPFHGELVEQREIEHYLALLFQRPVRLPPEAYVAVSPAALGQRILHNLRNVYLSRGDYAMAARVMDYLVVVEPANANLWQERGLFHYYANQWERAAFDLKRYTYLRGLWPSPGWGGENPAPPSEPLSEHDSQILAILREIEEDRRRHN
jgi:regulator of sirC expression with transglutaminase-like and TPR domain